MIRTNGRILRRYAGFVLIPLISGALADAAPAAGQATVEREITDSERRADQMRREQLELRDEMTRIRSRVSDLSSELLNLERQVANAGELLAELEYQIARREAQIKLNTIDLLRTRDRLTERRAVLHRRLRDIYKRGPLSTVEVLLAAEDFSDLLNRYRYLYLVARHDRMLADEVAALERQLVARERALRSDLAQLAAVHEDRGREHAELAMLQADQRLALGGERSRQNVTAQRLAELERSELGITEMVTALERTRGRAPAAANTGTGGAGSTGRGTLPLADARPGSLDWPVEGQLLYGFGPVSRPDGTVARWSGIGIGAPVGSPVRSVEAGTVSLAGPFDGYGPTVVISHAGGHHSLYLYLREVRVREGQVVQRGEEVGTVGGPSAGEGPHIEFQIRAPGGDALDPLEWLRPR